jgi:hypothetical protein
MVLVWLPKWEEEVQVQVQLIGTTAASENEWPGTGSEILAALVAWSCFELER